MVSRTDLLGLLSVESGPWLLCPLTGGKSGCSHRSRVVTFETPTCAAANPQKPSRAVSGSRGRGGGDDTRVRPGQVVMLLQQ